MTKTVKVLLGITAVGAIGTVIYILTHDKKTEVETMSNISDDDSTDEEHLAEVGKQVVEDLMDTAEVKIVEAREKVEEVTKDVVNRISRELARSNDYNIPPYEISHDTYIQPMGEWKKVSVFYDGEKFHGIYGEEYKSFVLGDDNVDNFISSDAKVMYIRNENLECDYAVYKGEDNGEN